MSFKKFHMIIILDIILSIPPIFGIFIRRLFIDVFSFEVGFILLLGILILLIIGILIQFYGYNNISLELIKQHEVINTIILRKNLNVLLIFFPLTMIMEEFIFRYYIISIFSDVLDIGYFWSILVSSIIFSLYHIHFWFRFKNLRITYIYIGYSFLLGFYLGIVLLTIGFIFCFLFHYLLTLFLYFRLAEKIKKNDLI